MTFEEKITDLGIDIERRSIRKLSLDELKIIDEIKSGFSRKYRLFGWVMSGQIAVKSYNERFNQLLSRHEMLRRRYLYKDIDEPMSVVAKYKNETIPVMDLSNEPSENQQKIIKNIASAEMRGLYNPEEDALIKIRIIIISDNKVLVLMKSYMNMGLPISPFDIRRLIFFNLKIDSSSELEINEAKIDKNNEDLEKKCLSYWRNELTGIKSPVKIPFEKKERGSRSEIYTIQHDIDSELVEKINLHAMKYEGTPEHVLLKQFGRIFGEYIGANNILLPIRTKNSYMPIFPCRVNTELELKESIQDINRQAVGYSQNCQCSFIKIMSSLSFSPRVYFDVAFEFIDDNEESERTSRDSDEFYDSKGEDISPRLDIVITYSDKEINIKYMYDSSWLEEKTINFLHESLIKLLDEEINKVDEFSWKKYIEECKSDEEKMQKLVVAQKALHIKQGDFIYTDDPDEVIDLSTNSIYGNYIVEDIICDAGKTSKYVGILIDGHIEERMTDPDGYLKTVSVYKAGYVLGMECLIDAPGVPFEYVAADNVKILWLPGELVKKAISGNNKSYESLLKKALKETNRLKKLWVLD